MKWSRHDFLSFLLVFMSLLTALIVKNNDIWALTYFIFLKQVSKYYVILLKVAR